LRAGYTLQLDPISGNRFQFASQADDGVTPGKGFYPLSLNSLTGLFPCKATSGQLNCTNGGKAFPKAKKIDRDENADNSRIYSFTSEHHSFFQLKGDEVFEFSGDDDVWVYLNEKLAVDVGGLHPGATSSINSAARLCASN